MGVLRSTKVALTGFELTSHTTVARVGYPLNYPGDGHGKAKGRLGEAYSFVACLSRMTIDHAPEGADPVGGNRKKTDSDNLKGEGEGRGPLSRLPSMSGQRNFAFVVPPSM